jgi:catechol 2,3-dioxygenase-like lactoylglutathione lyase family enzyme
MDDFFGRSVFFAKDAERSLAFYTETLGFSIDWNHQYEGKAFVFQVSLFGFQLSLNQTDNATEARAGHSRVFVGLDDEQGELLQQHIKEKGIETSITHWGNPTHVIRDPDGNELFFWLPQNESKKQDTA